MEINPYENAKKQILSVYDYLKNKWVSWEFIEEFLYPDRVIEVNIPVRMDTWDIKVFKWYRSQHKNIRWPYKGWIRFHPDVTKDEVIALSTWMSIKVWVVDLPLWGGKWGVIVNPKELSKNELEQLSRWYVRWLYKLLGPDVDVPAPDVNTNSQIMAWMVDEYSKLVWKWTPWAFTGKPLSLGGSKWREIATSLWWLYVLEKYLEVIWDKIEGKIFAIQGAWNAGLNFAKLIVKKWWKVIAISDSKGGVFDPEWIDIDLIEKFKLDKKSVVDSWYQKISNKELLELDVDVLVLAALENQITLDNAEKIKARIILELANWPTTPEADEILFKKWIIVLPDILANAWWVTVSYFEQIQWNMNYYWPEKEVYSRLESIMKRSTREVVELAKELNVDLRKAAYVISLYRQYDAWRYLR